MPGLSQLKKFSEDVADLGNELTIRKERGETPVPLVLPDVPDIDDSDDFVLGLPDERQEDFTQDSEPLDLMDDVPEQMTSSQIDATVFPELDSILNPVPEDDIDLSDFPELNNVLASSQEPPAVEEPSAADDFSVPDFDFGSLAEPVPEAVDSAQDLDGLPEIPDFDVPNEPIPEDPAVDGEFFAGDVQTVMEQSDGFPPAEEVAEPVPESFDGEQDLDGLPEIPDFDSTTDFATGADSALGIDNLDEIPNFSVDMDNSTDENDIDFASFDVPDSEDEFSGTEDAPHEIFDAPEDPFDGQPPVSSSEDDDFSDTPFDDFDIPGFSDQVAGAAKAKPTTKNEQREKNTLTDSEYEQFKKNLANYPLNLRIAIQEFIVNDEFKDNVVFDVVQKVLKRTSARQLALQLEKLLDISIPVPRDFERRTFEQYEEYKKSAEYQLKNRILPAAILAVMAGCILVLLALFGRNVVYRPLKAESLYKEGYALLENNAYPQSEQMFNQALEYQPKKKWFFRYADGYREHKQYERARMMYTAGLRRFNNDKELGLDYAEMELKDLRNFEEAERVVRREILDYHINDKDGMLLLGDIFLEWGDEKDSSKYEEARQIYAELLQLYGQEDIYLARMMRYFIRVDDLRNVLQLKEHFYPRKKSLGGQDLVELSGYLLDKSYGSIAPSDEYLLPLIQDVRSLLERAVKEAPEIPESYYNMGLYFVRTNNNANAKDWLEAAIQSFDSAEHRPRKRILNQINAYRLVGELYGDEHEYITAEDYFRTGIALFQEAQLAGLKGDHNVGLLYSDLADLNYFISGDLDEALANYLLAVETHNDTPSIRYRIGYIQYAKKRYSEALGSFIKTVDSVPLDTHVLLALGNVLSMRGDNFAAQGYYERLMHLLDTEKSRLGIMFPQTNIEHADMVEIYLKASNNLGVTLYRLARQTGNSALNASALTNLTTSVRAWDALTRNQDTMVRLPGTNLAERNISYMTHPVSDYEPSIYTEIPRMLNGEIVPD